MAGMVAGERVVMYTCPVIFSGASEYLLGPMTLLPQAHDRDRGGKCRRVGDCGRAHVQHFLGQFKNSEVNTEYLPGSRHG